MGSTYTSIIIQFTCTSGEKVRELRPLSYVRVYRIARAGHHVHADKSEDFNRMVNKIFKIVDREKDLISSERSTSGSEEGGSGSDENGEVTQT